MRRLLTRGHLLSLVGAPLIWGMHLLICYVLVSLACAFGFGGVHVGIGIVTLAALALLGWTGLANYRKWKEARRTNHPDADIQVFFSLNAMMLSVVSAAALIWVAVPSTMLPPCAA